MSLFMFQSWWNKKSGVKSYTSCFGIHSFIYSFIHSWIHSFIHSFVQLFIYLFSPIHFFLHTFMHFFISSIYYDFFTKHSFIHSFIYSSIYAFIHSSIHPFIPSFHIFFSFDFYKTYLAGFFANIIPIWIGKCWVIEKFLHSSLDQQHKIAMPWKKGRAIMNRIEGLKRKAGPFWTG